MNGVKFGPLPIPLQGSKKKFIYILSDWKRLRQQAEKRTQSSIPDRTEMRKGFYPIGNIGHLNKQGLLGSFFNKLKQVVINQGVFYV